MSRRPAVVLAAVVHAGLFAAAAVAPPVSAAVDVGLGQALYESRCTVCHDRSVHARNPRSAQTFRQIRAFVSRWDRELGARWRPDEIDAVTQYLNERYYHYACPAEVCGLALR